MSDLLLHPEHAREPQLDSFSDASNPVGLDGIEFVEYATSKPQALGQVLEMMGFRPVARHRSREVLLYRQGALNIVVNAHPPEGEGAAVAQEAPTISAVAFRVRDARAAYRHVLDRGAWEVPTHPEAMELYIPAIHGVGGTRIFFVDRYREFSIYDVDFVPIPSVDPKPPPSRVSTSSASCNTSVRSAARTGCSSTASCSAWRSFPTSSASASCHRANCCARRR